MITPKQYDEQTALLAYIDEQLDGIRCAAYGLTDEQAHLTPTRSTLSIGAILKHTAYVMDGFAGRREPGAFDPSADDFAAKAAAFMDSFVFAADAGVDDQLAAFDRSREAFVAFVGTLDPAADTIEPPAPWDGRNEPTTITWRYALLHAVEELARHAGHADIIREQVDGAQAGPLHFAAHGLPGNPFIQPWQPTEA